jgi:diguanylate cyclase (GGDEF)-like protein
MGHPLALALMDIDHFKAINDTHGHAVGDEALMSFTRTIRRNIREIDLLARFGGDEFVLLLPEADPEHAAGVVSRLRQALVEHPLNLGGMSVPITVSVGIAGLAPGGEDLDGLLRRADIALYRSKQAGRDRISLAQAED